MPATPEIEQQLAAQAAAKKGGHPLAFGRHGAEAYRTVPPEPRKAMVTARELIDLETLFGNQAVALEANLRAMLATLRQLQEARMRAFGVVDPAVEQAERTLQEKVKSFHLGSDGFIQRATADPNDSPSTIP